MISLADYPASLWEGKGQSSRLLGLQKAVRRFRLYQHSRLRRFDDKGFISPLLAVVV
jgi:hypothetical protein